MLSAPTASGAEPPPRPRITPHTSHFSSKITGVSNENQQVHTAPKVPSTPDVPKFGRCNNAMDRDWFKAQGAYLPLPRGYESRTQPDWRAVLFSVILPAPDVDSDPSFEWPAGWIPGRFRGLKKVQVPGEKEDGTGYELKRWRNDEGELRGDDFNFVPRVFHTGASSYFREPLRSSIGAGAADADPKNTAAAGQWCSDNTRNPTAVSARRFLFEPDLTREEKSYPPKCAELPTVPQAVFGLAGNSQHAQVHLMCAEYLTYSGPTLYSEKLNAPKPVTEHFLVLHVAAENCTSAELEAISGSLSKPREMASLKPRSGTEWSQHESILLSDAIANNDKGETTNSSACVNLLELFVRIAERALLPNAASQSALRVERGGFLEMQKSSQQTKPYTVTMALPGGTLETKPTPFKDEEPGPWSPADLWAWYLAVRFDPYNTDIPDLDAEALEYSQVARTQHWTLHSAEGGLTALRRNRLDTSNNSFMMLAPTRFVDLAILVRRADNYMLAMSKQLRAMRFDSEDLEKIRVSGSGESEVTQEQIRKAQKSLQNALDNFSKIQIELVYLRDHLWYEGVSGREMATRVLQHMLTHTGTRRSFDDLNQEVELRKDVYATRAQSYRISINALEAKREKAEDERRRQAAEAEEQREKEQQRQQDRTNLVLGIVALCFAIPGVFQLMPGDLTWGRFWLCVAVVIVASLGLVWFLLAEKSPHQRWRKK